MSFRAICARKNPAATSHVRAAIYASLQTLILFPRIGRPQKAKGVRKLVTRKYAYLIYYMIDDDADDIVILNVKHPARKREHSDAHPALPRRPLYAPQNPSMLSTGRALRAPFNSA